MTKRVTQAMVVSGQMQAVLAKHGYAFVASQAEPGGGVGTNPTEHKVAFAADGCWIHYKRGTALGREGKGAPALERSREAYANCGEADGEYGTWHSVKVLPPSKQRAELEKSLVYAVATSVGPDIAWERMGLLMRNVRRACPDIIAAFERGNLDLHVEPLVVGPKSDRLRHSADRYY